MKTYKITLTEDELNIIRICLYVTELKTDSQIKVKQLIDKFENMPF